MQNCYPKGSKITRETQDHQDERLSNKHIQTLKFLQDIVEENKQLKAKLEEYEAKFSECAELHDVANNAKARISEIQEKYLTRADQINDLLVEKHTADMMAKAEEQKQAEVRWLEEKEKLQLEIINLRKEAKKDKDSLDICKQHEHQIRMLDLKVAAQMQEIDRLNQMLPEKDVTIQNQTTEIERLHKVESKNRDLKEEISSLVQKNKELEFKISRMEKEMKGDTASGEKDELVHTLKSKLAKTLKEKTGLEEKEKEYLHTMEELKSELAKYKKALSDSEGMRHQMQGELEMLLRELDNLKRYLAKSDKEKERENFKEFVQLKRDVQVLREENDTLKSRYKSSKSLPGHLPQLKGASGTGGLTKGRHGSGNLTKTTQSLIYPKH